MSFQQEPSLFLHIYLGVGGSVLVSLPLRIRVRHFVLSSSHWKSISLSKCSIHFPVNILSGWQVCARLHADSHNTGTQHTHNLDLCALVTFCSWLAGSQESDSSQTAKKDMLAALRARQEALEETLKQRIEELKSICIREAVWQKMQRFQFKNKKTVY